MNCQYCYYKNETGEKYCEKEGDVLLGIKDHETGYCEEHAREIVAQQKNIMSKFYWQEMSSLDYQLEKAILVAQYQQKLQKEIKDHTPANASES